MPEYIIRNIASKHRCLSQYLVIKESDMKDRLPRYTLRIERELLDKLGYVAEYEGRTKNREIEQLIKKRVAEFEKQFGEIRLK